MTRSNHTLSQKTEGGRIARDIFSLEKSLLQQEKAISRLMFRGMPISEEEDRLQETLKALREQRLKC